MAARFALLLAVVASAAASSSSESSSFESSSSGSSGSSEEAAVCQAIGCCSAKHPMNAVYEWAKIISVDESFFNTKNTAVSVDQYDQTLSWSGHRRRRLNDIKVDLLVVRQNEDGSWIQIENRKNDNLCRNTPKVVSDYGVLLGLKDMQPDITSPVSENSISCPLFPGLASLSSFKPGPYQLSRNIRSGRHLIQFNFKSHGQSIARIGLITKITCDKRMA